MSRRFAFLLSLALVMAVVLTGCGMNKEKAIEQMGQALTDSSVIESGRLTGEISGTISLGADSIPMELTMEGAFKDQMQTMAMKMSGEVMATRSIPRPISWTARPTPSTRPPAGTSSPLRRPPGWTTSS